MDYIGSLGNLFFRSLEKLLIIILLKNFYIQYYIKRIIVFSGLAVAKLKFRAMWDFTLEYLRIKKKPEEMLRSTSWPLYFCFNLSSNRPLTHSYSTSIRPANARKNKPPSPHELHKSIKHNFKQVPLSYQYLKGCSQLIKI